MIYLNNAATSYPKPEAVYQAVQRTIRKNPATAGRVSGSILAQTENLLEQTRFKFKQLFGIRDSHKRIVFTHNGTDSLNIAIKGALSKGDHVIVDDVCHNSITRPLATLERNGAITVSRIPPDRHGIITPRAIKRAIKKNTKLIIITHGSNVTGVLQDIVKIGRVVYDAGKLFLVDAAQTAGAVPIDVELSRIDLLAAPGHKGLFGPQGTGILYVREGVQLRAIKEGGTGSFSENPFQPEEYPYFLESGTHNMVGIAGLRAGVDFILKEGVERICEREQARAKALYEGLSRIPGVTVYGTREHNRRAAPLAFTLEGFLPAEVGNILQESFGIVARTGLHCAPTIARHLRVFPHGTIRFSPGYFTTDEEIARAIDAVEELTRI